MVITGTIKQLIPLPISVVVQAMTPLLVVQGVMYFTVKQEMTFSRGVIIRIFTMTTAMVIN
jgi:hypothetical protein